MFDNNLGEEKYVIFVLTPEVGNNVCHFYELDLSRLISLALKGFLFSYLKSAIVLC